MYCSICGRYIANGEQVFLVFNRYEERDDDAIPDYCCVYCFNNLDDEDK